MKHYFRFFLTLSAIAFLFTACSKDDDTNTDDDDPQLPLGDYENGIFVLNEGGFGASNASVSFIDDEGNLHDNIYQNVNGTGLGDTAQSMGLDDDKAYVVINGSNTIEVVNRYTFESIATITSQLSNPRYIVFENDKGYVSNWGDPTNPDDDFVAIINLNSNTVEGTISVAEGPEKMVVKDGKLYVAQKGGYNYGNTVSVINLSNQAVSSIDVADVPDGLVIINDYLYVLSSGKAPWTGEETPSALTKIQLSDNTVSEIIPLLDGAHPAHLVAENSTMYTTIDGDIYRIALGSTTPFSLAFSVGDQGVYGIYGFAVNNSKIYVGDAGDFTSNGKVHIYSTSGELQSSYTVGVIPNGFYFN